MWWQSLKCLLSGSLQKWFATHDVESTSEPASLSTKSHCQCTGADPEGLSFPSTLPIACPAEHSSVQNSVLVHS